MLSPNATSEISWVWITDAAPASHITQVCNGLENFSYGKHDLKAEAPCFQHPPGTESFLLYLTHLHPGWRSSPGNRCHIVPWEDPRHAAPAKTRKLQFIKAYDNNFPFAFSKSIRNKINLVLFQLMILLLWCFTQFIHSAAKPWKKSKN